MDNHEDLEHLLNGREMSAVCLVRDYFEFHFDGPIVRALTDPYADVDGVTWAFRDAAVPAIHDLIGRQATAVVLEEDIRLAVQFGRDCIVIPLNWDDRHGPEAAHVIGVDEDGRTSTAHMWIW